jgi:hypothetical protein
VEDENFIMEDNAGAVIQNPEKCIFDQIYKKFGGIVMLGAVCGENNFFSATLTGAFISLLFTKSLLEKGSYSHKKEFNIGTSYCKIHKTYHRTAKYEKYDNILKKRLISGRKLNTNIFTNNEWKDLLSITTCKK